jgi:hypothetical protein
MIRVFLFRRDKSTESIEVDSVSKLFDAMYKSDVTNAIVELGHADFMASCFEMQERVVSKAKAAELASIRAPSFEFMNRTAVYALPGDLWRLTFDRQLATGQPKPGGLALAGRG